MMRFTGLGVGYLEYKAHAVHRLVVEDEPNWSELRPTTNTSEPDPTSSEDEDDIDSVGTPEDLSDDTF